MVEDVKPRNTSELLAAIDAEWQALHAAIGGLSAEQMTAPGEGGWSIKDNLAHVAEWEQFLLRVILGDTSRDDFFQPTTRALPFGDTDAMNAVLYERNRGRALDDVLAGLRRSHEQVVAKVEATPFASLLKPMFADRPADGPVLDWVAGNTYDHYREHRETIERQRGA
jgi:uncharacterized protein (TIGR03083 family)